MKLVQPKQLELAGVEGAEDLAETESPATEPSLGPDDQEVVRAANEILAKYTPTAQPDDDFNWHTDDSVILREQRATAVYRNRHGELIIRQQAAWDDEEDTFVYVTPENVTAFLEATAKKARE